MALATHETLSPAEAVRATPPGHVEALGDLLRQIGHDERAHELEGIREAARRSATS